MKQIPKDVGAYIAAAPKEARAKLVQLRRIIKAAAPGAEEAISYGMPYYKYRGALAGFAAFKNYIGLYGALPVDLRWELKGYRTSKGTIRFSLDKPLPVALIRKLVKARVKKNEVGRKNWLDRSVSSQRRMNMAFIDPSTLPQAEPKPGWHGRFFHSEHMTFAYYEIDAGATLHAHSHPNEEVWHIIEGGVDLTLSEETRCIRAGHAAVIPRDTTHAVAVKKGCRAIVVDYPRRREVGGVQV